MALMLLALNIALLLSLFATYIILNRNQRKTAEEIKEEINIVDRNMIAIEASLDDKFSRNKEAVHQNFKEEREEINNAFAIFEDSFLNRVTNIADLQKNRIDTLSSRITILVEAYEDRLEELAQKTENEIRNLQRYVFESDQSVKEDIVKALKHIEKKLSSEIRAAKPSSKQEGENFSGKHSDLKKMNRF